MIDSVAWKKICLQIRFNKFDNVLKNGNSQLILSDIAKLVGPGFVKKTKRHPHNSKYKESAEVKRQMSETIFRLGHVSDPCAVFSEGRNRPVATERPVEIQRDRII